jgi:DNA adenine methylase
MNDREKMRVHKMRFGSAYTPRGMARYEPRGKETQAPVKDKVVVTRPALRYYGGKWRLSPWILPRFPEHDCYVEPYAGAASLFFRKEASRLEVINDLNQDVVNFFRVLRDRAGELIQAIDYTPFSRQEYVESVAPVEDPLERARRFYVRCNQGRANGGYMGTKDGGWQFQVADKTNRNTVHTWSQNEYLWDVAARLKQAFIECTDAIGVIERYDRPRTLFYVDPPYPAETRERGTRYKHEMSTEDRQALSVVLHAVKGMVILSGYNCALYDELYADWTRIEKEALTTGATYRTECLWISPNTERGKVAQLDLFAA